MRGELSYLYLYVYLTTYVCIISLRTLMEII